MIHRLLIGLAVASLAFRAQAQTNLAPFAWDWSHASEIMLDLSRFLDAPAGKGGFVRVQDGHFVKADGSRLRLWGVNLTAASCFPSKDLAPRIADDLARFGFNIARFDHLDADWGQCIFVSKTNHTRAFDAVIRVAKDPPSVSRDLTPLQDATRVLINPHKGWKHHYPDNHINKYHIAKDEDLLACPGMDHLHLRLAWSYLEPKEGQFDWAVIDRLIDKWTAHGMGIAFRISCAFGAKKSKCAN